MGKDDFSLLPMIIYLLVTNCWSVTHGRRYQRAEEGVKGTMVLQSLETSSKVSCGAICEQDIRCQAFNWLSLPGGRKGCQCIQTLRNVTVDPNSAIYVPVEDVTYSSLALAFACVTCAGSNPPAWSEPWVHECQPSGKSVVVGVGGKTLSNMDQVLCAQLSDVNIQGAGAVLSNSGDCVTTMNQPAPVVSIWSDAVYYQNPSTAAFKCRVLTSGKMIDTNRCVTPLLLQNDLQIFGIDSPTLKSLLCPVHMVAVSFYQSGGNFGLRCCLLY